MVQLKTVSLRLKSITNIQKITKTMKMVSASKFTRAERELAAARPFGYGPRKFYQSARLPGGEEGATPPVPGDKAVKAAPAEPVPPADPEDSKKLKRIYIAMTSDRGLCGGVHSGVVRRIRREMATRAGAAKEGAAGASAAAASGSRIVAVGDKARGMLWRQLPEHMLLSVKDIGRTAPVFADASRLAAAVSTAGYRFDVAEIYYNKYFTPVKYELSVIPVFSLHRIEAAPNMSAFDDVDSDQLEMYTEWTTVALLYYALKQGAAAEQSARMAAMDNATKNAGDMIRKLTLLFNRTRQAVITRELIEIISGAAALN